VLEAGKVNDVLEEARPDQEDVPRQASASRALSGERARLLQLAPLAVFGLALLTRLWFVCGYHSPQDFVFSDMWVYDHRARNLLSGSLSAWDSFTPVGYPAALALVYELGGNALTVGVLQALLGALTALATWRLALLVFASPVLALCVGAACALHVPAIYYTGFLLTETLFSFLVVAGAWALVASIERRSRWGFLCCGLLLGVGATVRPNLLVFLPCVPVIIWLGSDRRWREAALSGAVLLAAFALPVAAAAAHNARLVGSPTLGTNGGLNFYLNFASVRGVRFRDARGEHGITPIPNLLYHSKDELVKVPFYADAHYFGRGLALLREEPGRLKVTGRNLVEASGVGRQGYWPVNDRERWPRLHRRVFFFVGILPSLLGLGLLGFRRRYAASRHRPLLVAAGMVLSSVVTLLLFLGDPRMRVPFDPLLILLAAAAFVWIGEALQRFEASRRSAAAAAS
jgi:4-amino-4-deoxy-L-arabinose transferase-like glycosyltransferase